MMTDLSHASIFKTYWRQISITYLMLLIENGGLIAMPFLLGKAINDLIAGQFDGLTLFIGVEVFALIVATIRRLYDTRAYGMIFKAISITIAAKAIDKDDDLSPAIGQADMLRELIEFFEWELTAIITSAGSVIGALIMLFVVAPSVGTVASVSTLVTGIVFWFSTDRIKLLNKQMNGELEARAATFQKRQRGLLETHFASLVSFGVQLSDIEARNFFISYVLFLILIIFALFDTTRADGITVGEVFTVLTYTSSYATGLLQMPWLYQQYLRTTEITERINDKTRDSASESDAPLNTAPKAGPPDA